MACGIMLHRGQRLLSQSLHVIYVHASMFYRHHYHHSTSAGVGAMAVIKGCTQFSLFLIPARILWKIKERVRNNQLQNAKQLLLSHAASGRQPFRQVKEGRIHQPLDHFKRRDVSTFPQVGKE